MDVIWTLFELNTTSKLSLHGIVIEKSSGQSLDIGYEYKDLVMTVITDTK